MVAFNVMISRSDIKLHVVQLVFVSHIVLDYMMSYCTRVSCIHRSLLGTEANSVDIGPNNYKTISLGF